MPVVCHGRSPKQPGGPSGSYVFQTWKRSGWSKHTLADAKKNTATVSICVKWHNYRGQWRRHGRQPLIYAYWGYGCNRATAIDYATFLDSFFPVRP